MRVIFTCGGTAGHVNPALALAALVAVGGAVYFAAALALMPSAVKQAVRRFRRR